MNIIDIVKNKTIIGLKYNHTWDKSKLLYIVKNKTIIGLKFKEDNYCSSWDNC